MHLLTNSKLTGHVVFGTKGPLVQYPVLQKCGCMQYVVWYFDDIPIEFNVALIIHSPLRPRHPHAVTPASPCVLTTYLQAKRYQHHPYPLLSLPPLPLSPPPPKSINQPSTNDVNQTKPNRRAPHHTPRAKLRRKALFSPPSQDQVSGRPGGGEAGGVRLVAGEVEVGAEE